MDDGESQSETAELIDPSTYPFPLVVSTRVKEEAFAMPHFTLRETQVGSRVAAGQSNKEISNELGLSIDRVKDICSSLIKKTGTGDRELFIAWVGELRYRAALRSPPGKPTKY